jgi:hypothetical protein
MAQGSRVWSRGIVGADRVSLVAEQRTPCPRAMVGWAVVQVTARQLDALERRATPAPPFDESVVVDRDAQTRGRTPCRSKPRSKT